MLRWQFLQSTPYHHLHIINGIKVWIDTYALYMRRRWEPQKEATNKQHSRWCPVCGYTPSLELETIREKLIRNVVGGQIGEEIL